MSERVLPEGWREVTLGDHVKVLHGWPFRSSDYVPGAEGLPVVLAIGSFDYGGGFRQGGRLLNGYGGEFPREFELSPGDLMMVMTCQTEGGEILGVSGVIPDDGRRYLHNQRIGRLQFLDAEISPSYLFQVTRWPPFNAQLVVTATGSKILHTAPKYIEAVRLPMPPLAEQRAIAEVLGALDDKIAANDTLAKSLLAVVNVEFSRLFGERPLRVALGSLADVVDCLHSKKPERKEEGRLLLQLDNILDDGLIDRAPRYSISDEDYAIWARRFEVRPWDFVITNVGRIGAVGRIPDDYVGALGRNMTGIRPYEPVESGSFIAAALQSKAVRREIEERTDAGSVMGALNVKSIPLLRLPESVRHERLEFHRFASPQFERADRARSESIAIRATRDALLPALMSGRLTVRDAEALAEEAGL